MVTEVKKENVGRALKVERLESRAWRVEYKRDWV